MDTERTWKHLVGTIGLADVANAQKSARALLKWLDEGGAPPQIVHRSGMVELDELLCRTACEHALTMARK